ncbi:aromatic amino acid transaminase [Aestuariibius sp. 2305UL40-4]|uniref:amino acid aminotransferase n=1 Tax=Aestuariibius violaceus TaxID=3234132 RepID=UPI00345E9C4D
MFEALTPGRDDPIIALMLAFREDDRPDKVDLGVGIYRDADGHTPVMEAIREAELRLAEDQKTKAYTALTGDPAFATAIRDLTLGNAVAPERVAFAGTPGGSGALRQAYELIASLAPDATIWLPTPSWPNHAAVLAYLKRPVRPYRYYDAATGLLDREGMLADLAKVPKGDVVLLHGCCHNPSGADPSPDDWIAIAETFNETGALPLIDLAYQGFGDGIEADVAGLRTLARKVPELLLCVSGSKTFGLYRDRAGVLLAVAPDANRQKLLQQALTTLNRNNYSFPPDHAGRLVTNVLTDAGLRQEWASELDQMRNRINGLRRSFAEELRRATNSDRFDGIATQKGMFSLLPLTADQIDRLRQDHGIYILGDGRINIAGLSDESIPRVASSITLTSR